MAIKPEHNRRPQAHQTPHKRTSRTRAAHIRNTSRNTASGVSVGGIGGTTIGNVGIGSLGETQKSKRSNTTSSSPRGTRARHSKRTYEQSSRVREQFAGKIDTSRPSLGDEEGGLFSRRNFLYGAIGVGAIAVVAGGGAAAYIASQGNSPNLETLEVPSGNVISLDDLNVIDDSTTCMVEFGNAELPLGSLVWCNSDEVAACLIPADTGKPLTKIGMLMLGSGTYNIVLDQAVGLKEGFEIFDVRMSSSGAIWMESNVLDGAWRIYTARIISGNLGEATLVDKGDDTYESPSIGAVGEYAFWQKQAPSTTSTSEMPDTEVLRTKFGDSSAETIFTSSRRMSTPLYASDDGIVITPRSKISRSCVSLVKIDAKSCEIMDGLTLPQSMVPFEVGYGDTGFMFSFENIYSYGDGIANLGTYVPRSKVSIAEFSWSDESETTGSSNSSEQAVPFDNTANYSNAKWFRFSRTPAAAPAFCGKYLLVKSSYSVCGVNLDTSEYFAIDVDNGADTYGEYLASTGSHDRAVTFTSIDYKPVNDDEKKLCRVKIWQPVG